MAMGKNSPHLSSLFRDLARYCYSNGSEPRVVYTVFRFFGFSVRRYDTKELDIANDSPATGISPSAA